MIAGTKRDLVLPLVAARAFNRPLTVRAREKDLRVSELLRTTSASAIVRVEVEEQAPIGPRSLVVELGDDTFEVPVAVVIDWERAQNVSVDLMPGTCPNRLAAKAEPTFRAAFLGGKDLDPGEIDPASVRLEGVTPVSHRLVDIGAPALDEKGSCPANLDDVQDLELAFDRAEVMAVAGPVLPGFELSLELTATLADGRSIRGQDAIMLVD